MWWHHYPVPRSHPASWAHQVSPGGSDHLYNFLTAAGAVAAVVALAGGVLVAIYYRHKATLSIAGEVVTTDSGTVLAVRPAVSAVGPFKLKFADPDGAVVRVTPVLATKDDGTFTDTANAKKRSAFPPDITGKPQFVSPGETLASSRLFRVEPSTPRLLGWFVSLTISSTGLLRHGLHWADLVFVPVASPPTTGGVDAGREVQAGGTGQGEKAP
jgi:hypothetical protein